MKIFQNRYNLNLNKIQIFMGLNLEKLTFSNSQQGKININELVRKIELKVFKMCN